MRLSHEIMLALTYVSGISDAEALRDRFIESINELDIPCGLRFSHQAPGDLPEGQVFPIKTMRSAHGFVLAEGSLGPDETAILRNGFQFLAVLLENREQADRLLRESEDKFEHMFNNSVIGKSITYPSGEMEPNQAFADMLGYAIEELKGLRWQDVTHPDDMDKSLAVVDSILAEERSNARFTKRYLRKDGQIVWTDVMTSIRRDSQGAPLYLMSSISDISERVRVETALRQSEEKWRNIIINTPQIGISLDPDGRLVFANHKFLELTGWREEEVLGQDWFELCIPAQIRESIRTVFRRVMDDEDASGYSAYENAILTKAGESRTIAWTNALTRDLQGKIAEVTCLGIDLTERLRAEQELKESESKYRLLVENQTDLIVKVDLEGRLLFVSPSYCRTFGRTEGELLGEPFIPLVHEEDRAATAQAMEALFAPPHAVLLEQRAMTRDGWRWFAWQDTGVLDSDGEVVEIIGVGRDITARKEAEQERERLQEQLLRAQRMEAVGTLAGGIAHDFNNILASVIGFAELALDEVEPASNLAADLQEIHAGSKRARELVRQILAFAQRSEEPAQTVRANDMAEEVLRFIRASIPSSIAIRSELESKACVKAAPVQLHQALLNLCTNAAHAMNQQGGVLTLRVRDVEEEAPSEHEAEDWVEIQVSDTGVGIQREHLASVFDPFFTTKQLGKGTGLGLSMVHTFVHNAGGSIQVESDPGEGSTFTLRLPRAAAPESVAQTEEETLPGGTERILLVDDERSIVRLGQRILEPLGYAVLTAPGSREALELFRRCPQDVDLVISDLTMPGMTGDKLAEAIRQIRPDMPIILSTGNIHSLPDGGAGLPAGVRILEKPFEHHDLLRKVRRSLDMSTEVQNEN